MCFFKTNIVLALTLLHLHFNVLSLSYIAVGTLRETKNQRNQSRLADRASIFYANQRVNKGNKFTASIIMTQLGTQL